MWHLVWFKIENSGENIQMEEGLNGNDGFGIMVDTV